MRRYGAVLGWFAKSSLWGILGVLAVLCLGQSAVFAYELKESRIAYEAGLGMASLERLVDRCAAEAWFAFAFVAVTVLLCLPGCSFRAHPEYTLRRLSISEKAVLACQAGYNFLIYGILFAAQLATLLCLGLWYVNTATPQVVGSQALFLAFWKSEFLHALFPMTDGLLWVKNVLLGLSMAFAAALVPYRQRRGRISVTVIGLAAYTVVFFSGGIGELFELALTVLMSLIVLGEVLSVLLKKEETEGEQEVTDEAVD